MVICKKKIKKKQQHKTKQKKTVFFDFKQKRYSETLNALNFYQLNLFQHAKFMYKFNSKHIHKNIS